MVIVVTVMPGVSPGYSGGSEVYLFEYCNCRCPLFRIVGCLVVFCGAHYYYGYHALTARLSMNLRPTSLVGFLCQSNLRIWPIRLNEF